MKTNHFSTRRYVPAIFSILTFLFCFTFSAYSTDYYISPSGNDVSGKGTSSNPWKTLYKATSVAAAVGDIIHVTAGTYLETAQCLLKPGVSIEGEGVTSIIQSTVTANFTSILFLASASEGTNGNQHISNLKFDGQNLSSAWGISVVARNNVSIHHCTVINFREVGVNFSGITSQNGATAPTVYAAGNSFYNNIVTNCSTNDSVYGRGCMQFGGQMGMLVHDNVIYQPYRTGTFTGNIGWPMKMANEGYIKDCKVYNNTLTRALFTGAGHGVNNDWNFSFEMWNAEKLEFYGNTCQGEVDLANVTKGSYTYGLWFHHNTVTYPARRTYYQSGLRLETNESDHIIEDNHFKNMQNVITFSPKDYKLDGFGIDVHRITIRRNLMDSLGFKSGAGNYGTQQAISMENFENPITYFDSLSIYNNTIICDPVDAMYIGILVPCYAGGKCKNIRIVNNIVQGFTLNPYWLNPSANVDSLYIKNNNFYRNGSNSGYFSGGLPAHYFNSGNITADPLYVGNGNYTLQSGSPCIDAGVYVGLPFAGVAPDRGYAEMNLALPIKLLDLTVSEKNSQHLLQWKTETEVNSDHFTIERSSDGQNYTAIGTVKAADFSSTIANYIFTDAAPLDGINYYRLLMVDKDNSFERSNIVSIANKQAQGIIIVSAQLSAGKRQAAIKVTSTQSQKANLVIFDQTGRVFLSQAIFLQKGLNTIDKNTPEIARGVYYFKVFKAEEMLVKNSFTID
ncbi:MAG: hypothetical protein ACQUYJ_09415 [Ferruginibacter sp.]